MKQCFAVFVFLVIIGGAASAGHRRNENFAARQAAPPKKGIPAPKKAPPPKKCVQVPYQEKKTTWVTKKVVENVQCDEQKVVKECFMKQETCFVEQLTTQKVPCQQTVYETQCVKTPPPKKAPMPKAPPTKKGYARYLRERSLGIRKRIASYYGGGAPAMPKPMPKAPIAPPMAAKAPPMVAKAPAPACQKVPRKVKATCESKVPVKAPVSCPKEVCVDKVITVPKMCPREQSKKVPQQTYVTKYRQECGQPSKKGGAAIGNGYGNSW